MAWLTNEEREANARRDRDAQTRGFGSAHEESEHRKKRERDALVESAIRKLTSAELEAVKQKARSTGRWEW